MNLLKQVIIIRNDLKLGKGKIAAQCCHASIESFLKTLNESPKEVQEWLNEGQKKVILKAKNEKELMHYFQKLKKKFPSVLIKDAGLTQLKPGTKTCIGIGPVKEKEINEFIKDLKLL